MLPRWSSPRSSHPREEGGGGTSEPSHGSALVLPPSLCRFLLLLRRLVHPFFGEKGQSPLFQPMPQSLPPPGGLGSCGGRGEGEGKGEREEPGGRTSTVADGAWREGRERGREEGRDRARSDGLAGCMQRGRMLVNVEDSGASTGMCFHPFYYIACANGTLNLVKERRGGRWRKAVRGSPHDQHLRASRLGVCEYGRTARGPKPPMPGAAPRM